MTGGSAPEVVLPHPDGTLERRRLHQPRAWATHAGPFRTRRALAAAHVVADPYGDNVPGAPAVVDWDATLAFRRHLFAHGFGVAEAMDTAQRGMGLDWPSARELIRRSAAQAAALGADIVSGAGTDQLPPGPASLDQVVAAYEEQVGFVEATGSRVVLMASRHLAAAARDAADYLDVYDRLLGQVSRPVVLHWLGEVFDPALRGYWGSPDLTAATATFTQLVHRHQARVDGVKVSLLSAEHEVALRRSLPPGVRLYTGDDFHYAELIEGDGLHHSDALLGAFAAIAPAASAALTALDQGDVVTYRAELAPTVPLSRHLFGVPTSHYKTGVAFLAWLAGHQDGFGMVGGLQSARSLVHLGRLLALADAARLLPHPDLAAYRWGLLLAVAGIRS